MKQNFDEEEDFVSEDDAILEEEAEDIDSDDFEVDEYMYNQQLEAEERDSIEDYSRQQNPSI